MNISLEHSRATVVLGEHDTTNNSDGAHPQEINIISKVAHEAFDTKTFQNDVAVLKLARRVEFNSKWGACDRDEIS